MAYRFVQSTYDFGLAKGPRLAIVWHMAEGGGTVGYLSGNSARLARDKVSVHFVIDYEGDITQMLRLDHMHSSIRTSAIRTTNDTAYGDPPIQYGRSAALAIMDKWADIAHGTLGPNHASIAVEIQGYSANGPNAKQTSAIDELDHYLHTLYPEIASLGHRDFADYKACPGQHFPWSAVGGHAIPPAPESDQETPVNVVQPGRIATSYGGRGIFSQPVQDNKYGLRATVAGGEAFRILGNTEGFQLVESLPGSPNPVRGWIRNEVMIDFREGGDCPAVAPAPDCSVAVKTATDPLNAKIAELTADLSEADATIRTQDDIMSRSATDLRTTAAELEAA